MKFDEIRLNIFINLWKKITNEQLYITDPLLIVYKLFKKIRPTNSQMVGLKNLSFVYGLLFPFDSL